MFKIAVISANGGIGRTTLTAHLASLLSRRNQSVLALDFDPNNLLSLHFGLSSTENDGLVLRAARAQPWQDAAFSNAEGITFLPFGNLEEIDRANFGNRISAEPNWLSKQIDKINLSPSAIVLIDTPRLPSVFAQQAIAAADLILGVVAADASSYAKLPSLQNVIRLSGKADQAFYVVNYADSARRLHNDIVALMQNDLGTQLLPYFVHHDEAVPESLAANSSLADYAPHGQATHDLQGLVGWLLSRVASKQ
jgi:cellulose synthase operon protein YhjQ